MLADWNAELRVEHEEGAARMVAMIAGEYSSDSRTLFGVLDLGGCPVIHDHGPVDPCDQRSEWVGIRTACQRPRGRAPRRPSTLTLSMTARDEFLHLGHIDGQLEIADGTADVTVKQPSGSGRESPDGQVDTQHERYRHVAAMPSRLPKSSLPAARLPSCGAGAAR